MNTLELKIELLKICLEKGLDLEFNKYGTEVRLLDLKSGNWLYYEIHIKDNQLQELIERVKQFKKQDDEN